MSTAARSDRTRIVVSGMIAGEPGQGGAAWAVLQYVLGLRRLGHQVTFVEPVAMAAPDGPSARYLAAVAEQFGFANEATLVGPDGHSAPMPGERLARRLRDADLLLNVSGMLTLPELEAIPIRAYLDLDPFFNQAWHQQGADMRFGNHTHFATVAAAIGEPTCGVPTLGFDWIRTLPPVVLAEWPPSVERPDFGFTTVGHWRSYGPIEHGGERYGMRAHSLRALIDLPSRCRGEFELALGIDPGDRDDLLSLERHGWRVLDPATVASTPARYAGLIRASTAEIGIAKEGYVRSRSGWFSDRSAAYLASGRPVVAQDTGFGRSLPTGAGLLAISDVESAAAAVDEVLSRPAMHAAAARGIAEEILDSDRVLTALLDRLGASR
jgi:hypothetical protein